MEDLLMHTQTLSVHIENLLMHTQTLSVNGSGLPVHRESWCMHAETLSVNIENLFMHTQTLSVNGSGLLVHRESWCMHAIDRQAFCQNVADGFVELEEARQQSAHSAVSASINGSGQRSGAMPSIFGFGRTRLGFTPPFRDTGCPPSEFASSVQAMCALNQRRNGVRRC
jgi:hypothetical protein